MKTMRSPKPALLLAALLLIPTFAQANIGVGPASGFWRGVAHPLGGFDHILAMVAVGLWAVQRGGRAIWAVPLTFVTVMVLGGALGMAGVAMPFAEQGIIASVLLLGVLIAAAVRLPLVASAMLVGLFALFHGHSHGTEMPATVSGLAYGAGFVAATAFLHALGISFGLTAQRLANATWIRAAGGIIAGCGAYLLLA